MNLKFVPPRQISLACAIAFLVAVTVSSSKAADPRRFEKEIAAFEKADRTNPPPQHAIEFLGSSTIRKWTTLARDHPGHKVFNRGFGGSEISDSIYYFDRIVRPYRAKMIVFYAGSNDLNAGKSVDEVVADLKAFVNKVEESLPEAKVAFISINASPSRWKDLVRVKDANRQIAAFMAGNAKRAYIDTFSAMLGNDGQPRPKLYVADRLHLNAKGYAIWTPIIAPFLGPAE